MITPVPGTFIYSFLGQSLHLLPQKGIYWAETKTLIVADLHVGKVNHFRKAGISLPQAAGETDYKALEAILNTFPVDRVLILGDLFHSTYNESVVTFSVWRRKFLQTDFILIKGNHDILKDSFYIDASLKIVEHTLIEYPFVFSHIPLGENTTYYNLSGHLHPAVRLIGKAKQSMVLPCFYFGQKNGILPAFSTFSGKATLTITKEDTVFVIAGQSVKLPGSTNRAFI